MVPRVLTALRRSIWTLILRAGAFVEDARWIVLSVVLAVVGVVGVWIPFAQWLSVGLAAVSAGLLVNETRSHAARLRSIQFPKRAGDRYTDVIDALASSPRFEVTDAEQGHLVIDWSATSAIAAGTVTARLAPASYRLPRELRGPGSVWRRRRVAGRATYNGRLVGLNTNVGMGPAMDAVEWELVPARYWDHLASDILAMRDVRIDGRLESGRRLYVDRRGAIRDFGDSWLLNGIGTSVLAITTDFRLVAVVQSDHNESSGGLLAPSGSGSLEPRDVQGARTSSLREIVARGALREMAEEAAVLPDEVVRTAFLGFGRWLEKAAKPEFFTLALLTIDSHEVSRRRVPRADRPYTVGVDLVRMNPLGSWDPLRPRTVLGEDSWIRLSVPLVASLHLLVRAANDVGSSAGDLVRQALGSGD